MSTQAANTPAKASKDPVATLRDYLEARRDALGKIVAGGLNVERCTRVALAHISKTPRLLDCTPQSIYSSINQALQLGLEPGGPLGHAYLVPYGNECTLVIGYKGIVALARRSGEIATIEVRAVFANERIHVDFGTTPLIEHAPCFTGDPGACVAVYAIATMRSGEKQFDVMSLAETEAIRGRSKAKDNGPWKTDTVEMRKKCVVKRLGKMLPLSIELVDQLSAEDEADMDAPVVEMPKPRQTRAEAERKVLAERVAEPAEEATVPASEPERETVPAQRGEAPKEEPKAAKPDAPADDPNKGLDEAQQIVDAAEAATDLAELGALRGGYLALEKSGRVAAGQLKRVAKALHEAGKRLEAKT